MKLADHFTHSGGFLFRWRSYFPLILLPLVALAVLDDRLGAAARPAGRLWQIVCLVVSLAGLAARCYTIGTAPAGTSERSTVDPRASRLNTDGIYSVVRHPLYLGNTLIALGLASLIGRWYLPVIVLLASLLYHERIAAREEAFLEERFGDEFREWADRVPALVPRATRFRRPPAGFNWSDVVRREAHALAVIGTGFFLFDLAGTYMATGAVAPDHWWTALFAISAGLLLVTIAWKKLGRILGRQ
jgi:protein-S-isoprenylcysteine O-methyltransferase Ste14